jgi:hypothetical protein
MREASPAMSSSFAPQGGIESSKSCSRDVPNSRFSVPFGTGSADFGAFIRKQNIRKQNHNYSRIIREANIKEE